MKVAVIQLNAKVNKQQNIDNALVLTNKAIQAGARLVCLPEMFNYRGLSSENTVDIAEYIPGRSILPFLRVAKEKKVYVLAGSICEKAKNSKKAYNTSVVINTRGEIIAKYRKINLFKAVVEKTSLNETRHFLPGKALGVAKINSFNLGLTICYDVRFPTLYQRYAKRNCHILAVPSCFTKKTGEAHWETLVRARAIENLCYVLAPNQTGKDKNGVCTYGNSLIVDPWGKVLARATANKEEIIYSEINMSELRAARCILPSINQEK